MDWVDSRDWREMTSNGTELMRKKSKDNFFFIFKFHKNFGKHFRERNWRCFLVYFIFEFGQSKFLFYFCFLLILFGFLMNCLLFWCCRLRLWLLLLLLSVGDCDVCLIWWLVGCCCVLRAARANTFRIHNQLSSQAAQAADRSRLAAAAAAAVAAAAAAKPNRSEAEPSRAVARRDESLPRTNSDARLAECPPARLPEWRQSRKSFEFRASSRALS